MDGKDEVRDTISNGEQQRCLSVKEKDQPQFAQTSYGNQGMSPNSLNEKFIKLNSLTDCSAQLQSNAIERPLCELTPIMQKDGNETKDLAGSSRQNPIPGYPSSNVSPRDTMKEENNSSHPS